MINKDIDKTYEQLNRIEECLDSLRIEVVNASRGRLDKNQITDEIELIHDLVVEIGYTMYYYDRKRSEEVNE